MAIHPDRAGRDGIGAGDGAHEFGAPGADNAGDTEHLARLDRKTHVGEGAFGARQALNFDQRRGLWAGQWDRRKHAVQRPADHVLDQRLRWNLRRLVRPHELSVPQHRDAVGDAGDLVEPMTDIDEAYAFLLEAADLFEQPLRLLRAKRGGRLVENEQARVQR